MAVIGERWLTISSNVLIPRIEAVPETASIPIAPSKGEVERRILIIEDNNDVRESLRILLETAGHKIFEADSGLSGVASAFVNRPDVPLIDIGLPGIDGYEVARCIRSASEAVGMTLIARLRRWPVERSYRSGPPWVFTPPI